MKEDVLQINFDNKSNPHAFFEIVLLEELINREMDHSPFENHAVKFFVILFITEGQGYHTIDFTDYQYNSGTVFLIRKDQLHKFFKSTNVKGYVMVFTEEFILSHLNQLQSSKALQLFNEVLSFPKIDLSGLEAEMKNLENLIGQIETEYSVKDEYSNGIARSILHIIITKLFRIKTSQNISKAKQKHLNEFLIFQKLVEENCFVDRKVASYAKQLGCTSKTLNNLSQRVVKKTAKTFIDEITILQIKRLLIGTPVPIKEIAYTVGFDDPSNFFKYFKKSVGTSPEVFRLAHQ